MARRPQGPDLRKRKAHDLPGKHSSNDTRYLSDAEDALVLPKLNVSSIQPPKWMTDDQKIAFLGIRDTVSAADVAAITDVQSLTMLCELYAYYGTLNEQINEDGLTVVTLDGKGNEIIKVHPLLSERGRTFSQLRALLVEFGMTPSSRRSVKKRDADTPNNNEDEEWDALLN